MTINQAYINNTRTGDVWLRDFDRGVIETLGGQITGSRYYVGITGLKPPPYPDDWEEVALRATPMPGIPIRFASADDRIENFVLPCIVVRRDSIEEELSRWPSRHLKYSAPADGATAVQVTIGNTTINGFSQYEQQQGGFPYDITYLISVLTSGMRAEGDAQVLLKHVLRTYRPRDSLVRVMDSVGSERTYDAWSSGPNDLREALDIVDRQGGYSISVKVLGELDLYDPYLTNPMTEFILTTQYGLG